VDDQTGAQKLHNAESVIIFDRDQAKTGSTSPEAESLNSDKIGSTPTKRGRRKRGKLNRREGLGVSHAGVMTAQESGTDISIINLPNNSFATVYHNSWACVKCSNFYPGVNALGNICEACR
jgi:hypothetical protein